MAEKFVKPSIAMMQTAAAQVNCCFSFYFILILWFIVSLFYFVLLHRLIVGYCFSSPGEAIWAVDCFLFFYTGLTTQVVFDDGGKVHQAKHCNDAVGHCTGKLLFFFFFSSHPQAQAVDCFLF